MTAGRPKRRFTLRRLRLINFHNFVDETIEVPSGGHLFLMGDNGSGKTTVLDALHLVVSGGQELELNAAARIGGRRDEGRTLQGIVLRFDAERGVLNEGGATGYAVLELVDGDGEALCIGIGLEATTLEARVVQWGILAHRALAEVPLLEDDAPMARERLRDALGPGEVFLRMTEYRRAIADRLFGGPEPYEEVCRFWAMAKSYREIVAGARDFGALFQRLLPAPNAEVFQEILRSLKEIDGLEVTLGEIEAQRGYVAALVELAAEVERAREAAARYRWLEKRRRLDGLAAEEAEAARREEELALAVEQAAGRLAASEARAAQAEDSLRAAEDAGEARAMAALRSHEAREAELQGALRTARADAVAVERRLAAAARAGNEARKELHDAVGEAMESLARAVNAAPGVPPAVLGIAARWSEATDDLPEVDAGAAQALAARAAAAESSRREASQRVDVATTAAARAQAEVAQLAEREEEIPTTPGFLDAMSAAAASGIQGAPLFQLVEPRPDAPAEALAALEALAGDDVLAAWVPAEGGEETAAARFRRVAPAVRSVVRVASDAALAGWIQAVLEPPRDALARRALQALATALAQPASLGEVSPPAEGGALEHRGAAFATRARPPRLLGAAARRRTHGEKLAAARDRLEVAERELLAARVAEEDAAGNARALAAVEGALRALSAPALHRRHTAALARRTEVAHAQELVALARARVDRLEEQCREATGALDALRARLDPQRMAELERRLADLRVLAGAARAARDAAREQCALVARDRDDAAAGRRRLAEERRRAEDALAEAARRLRSHLEPELFPDDAGLERYVRETRRGDQFRSLEAIEEAVRAAERDEQRAADELGGDGSRGVRSLVQAARFGFVYEPAPNRIADRRDQPAAGVLAEIDRELAEQREVVGEKTRRLMDTLVMGTLTRHLQDHVDRLYRMVKDINRMLAGLRFGAAEYQFQVTPRPERRELVETVRSLSILDEASRARFRAWIDERLPDLKGGAGEGVPELLDYRRWYDYRLRMRAGTGDGVELTRELRMLGSGGEQGVPNYLLALALAKLMFDNADARVRPLCCDEAFYGIDAGRRDQLLRFATDLGLQLVVASPDQDGVTPSVRYATTLFVVKDGRGDVHLAPYHYWNLVSAQPGLFDDPSQAPAPEGAECRLADS